MIYILKIYISKIREYHIKINALNGIKHFFVPLNVAVCKLKLNITLRFRNFGFVEINKKGNTRVLIEFESFVIKIPCYKSFSKGRKKNRKEYMLSELFDFVCPVKKSLFYSSIIIVNYACPISDKEFKKLEIEDYVFFNNRKQSFGKTKNKIVIV